MKIINYEFMSMLLDYPIAFRLFLVLKYTNAQYCVCNFWPATRLQIVRNWWTKILKANSYWCYCMIRKHFYLTKSSNRENEKRHEKNINLELVFKNRFVSVYSKKLIALILFWENKPFIKVMHQNYNHIMYSISGATNQTWKLRVWTNILWCAVWNQQIRLKIPTNPKWKCS